MIELLKWDSSFFNKRIGKYEVKGNFEPSVFMQLAGGYDLIYVFSREPIQLNSKFQETKLTFSKLTDQRTTSNNSIRKFDSVYDSYEELLELAFLSGHQSRFFKDPFFPKDDFSRLYKTWIDKNLNAIGEDVLVSKLNNKVIGFVSYKEINDSAQIELIAVHPDYHGRGIGRKLLDAVEYKNMLGTKLLVSTQGSNSQAIAFYLKYGFEQIEKQHIYHYVPNDTFQ